MATETVEGEIIDEQSGEIATVPAARNGMAKADEKSVSATQGRVDAITELMKGAYANASKLVLTPDETAKLQAPFPDHAFQSGAGGNAKLIYIEHVHLRQRLNEVLGLGQWTMIQRSLTTEDAGSGIRVYVECALLIRGCFVDEAYGDMVYYPKNAASNRGDAIEGAKSAALRRLAKALGVGLQAWDKGWCEGWWKRNPSGRVAQQEPQDFITPEQAGELTAIMKQLQSDKTAPKMDAWLAWLGAVATDQILAKDYDKALADLKRRMKPVGPVDGLGEWKAWLDTDPSIDKINERLAEIAALAKPVKLMISETLEKHGVVFDKATKKFVFRDAS